VTVLTYFKGNDVDGIEVIRTAPTPYHAQYEVGSSRHKYVFDVLLSERLLRELVSKQRSAERYDLIHAHLHEGGLIGSVVGKRFGLPVVMDYQGSLTDEMMQHKFLKADGAREKFWRGVEQRIERGVDAIFTSTLHAADKLKNTLAPDKVHPLLDGVNTDIVHPRVLSADARAAKRAELGIAPDEICVVFLGLLAQHQGIQNLIDAASHVKRSSARVKWLIMGYPGADAWRETARQAGNDDVMIFTGRVAYGEMPHMLALGDLAVAPKLSQTEGSGKILNYMAMELPTIAFDTDAQTEILGELGIYAPTGDTVALANRVIEWATRSADERRTLGAQLRARAHDQFSWQQRASDMMHVYTSLCR
jgi:glycosyltransferase involved in cell wall biosynthesis